MTPSDRWMRRLIVGVVSGVSLTFVATTTVAHQMTITAWVAVVLFAGAEVACFIAGARPLGSRSAAAVVCVGALLPVLGSAGRAPDAADYGAGVWYVAAVLALVLLLIWGARPVAGWVVVAVLVAHTFLWGGVGALASLSVFAMVILLGVVSAARVAIIRAETALDRAAASEREAIGWRTLQEAYHQERQSRLAATAGTTGAMLQRIVDARGRLTASERLECRLLEQTVRDEIRGRKLLNPAVRQQILAHRRRGAVVQVNDDGGLDHEERAVVDGLLQTLASALDGITSDRIVIRTLPADSRNAIALVATTSDPVAAALGLDSDDDLVDLWLEIPRSGNGTSVATCQEGDPAETGAKAVSNA